MAHFPLVSIIMCCYNGSKYIARSFTSILEQTYSNIELIFVNDGSTDNSFVYAQSYVKQFEEKGFHLKVLTQDNKGAGYATMVGLSHATGEFLTLLDVDDCFMSESVRARVEFLLNHPDYNLVRSNGYIVKEGDLQHCMELFVKSEKEKKKENIFEDLLLGKTNNWAGSYMLRLPLLQKFYRERQMPTSRSGQNLQLLLPVSYCSKSGFIDIPLMKYIHNDASFSQKDLSLQKQISLMKGYWSIRYEMLDVMGICNSQLNLLIKKRLYELILDLCLSVNDKGIYNQYYKELASFSQVNLKTKMEYAVINKLPSALFYRILYKLKRIIDTCVQ